MPLTYTVVGVNIKRENVLSPNNEEVANSSKKHTQFKTRVHKPYPFQTKMVEIDTLFQTKRITAPRGAKNALQMSLTAYASETNKVGSSICETFFYIHSHTLWSHAQNKIWNLRTDLVKFQSPSVSLIAIH